MSEIYCECDCKYCGIDNICINEVVSIGPFGCEDYEKEPEPICPDKFYGLCKDDNKSFIWLPKMGIKGEWRGREIFTNGYDDNIFTDGRTGVLGAKNPLESKSDDELAKIFLELEQHNGLSPLYTKNLKYPVKESYNLTLEI